MREFDLEAALDGEPVRLNNGRKAFALYDLRKYPTLLKASGRLPINGIMLGNTEDDGDHITWDEFGESQSSYLSIIGMWEEPIKVEDLPKPFKPKQDETYFYICAHNIHRIDDFSIHSSFDRANAENGQCFRAEADAQKWVDFMKSMME